MRNGNGYSHASDAVVDPRPDAPAGVVGHVIASIDSGGSITTGATMGLSLVLLLPLLFLPLGPDDGVFFTVGRMILQGAVHYRDVIDVKPPLIYHLYALAIALFGPHQLSIRGFDYLLQGLTCMGLYWLVAGAVHRRTIAALAAVLYAVLYVSLGSQNTAQPESYVGLLAIAAFWIQMHRRTPAGFATIGLLIAVLFGLKVTLGGMLVAVAAAEVFVYDPRTAFRAVIPITCGFVAGAMLLIAWIVISGGWHGFQQMQQFIRGYALLLWSSGAMSVTSLVSKTAGSIVLALSIAVLTAMWSGISQAMHADRSAEADQGPRPKTVLPRLCALGVLAMVVSIVAEGKFFPYHLSRLFPFAVILAAMGTVSAFDRIATSPTSSYRRLMVAPLAALVVVLSPLPRYGWHSMAMILWCTKGTAAVDAHYSRQNTGYSLISLKAVGRYVRTRRKPGQRMVAISSVAGLLYMYADVVPDVRVMHSAFLLAPFAPRAWRFEFDHYIARRRPAFIVAEHGDRLTNLDGTSLESADVLMMLDTSAALLRRGYHVTRRYGPFDILEPIRDTLASLPDGVGFSRRLDQRHEVRGRSQRTHRVDGREDVERTTGDEQFIAAEDVVVDGQPYAIEAPNRRDDGEQVIVAGGANHPRGVLKQRQHSTLALDRRVGHPDGAQQFGTSGLEVFEVDAVVDDPHLIGVAVADADGGFAADHAALASLSFCCSAVNAIDRSKEYMLLNFSRIRRNGEKLMTSSSSRPRNRTLAGSLSTSPVTQRPRVLRTSTSPR